VAGRRQGGSIRGLIISAGLAVAILCGLAAPAGADQPVIARTANLTDREVDLGTGATRIASASVRQDRVNDRAQATVTLDAAPEPGSNATLVVAFGPIDGGVCQLNDFLDADQYATPLGGAPATGWSRDGRTFRLDIQDEAAGYQPWECAGAIVGQGDQVLSFLGGNLTDVLMKPDYRIERPEILERKVKGKLNLSRGAAHTVRIPVTSLNQAEALNVKVSGSGRGLKVRGESDDSLYPNNTSTFRLQVRATGKRAGPLKVKVTSANGATRTRKIPVKLVRPPARPAPGEYRSADGDVTFRITGGRTPKVKGFRIYTRTRCGGYGDFPTYTNNYYSFPTAPIGGGGVIDRGQRTKLYVVSLELKAVGRKVTEGGFSYGVLEAPCSASDSFTARRVGR